LTTLAVVPVSAEEVGQYRKFLLGSTVASVSGATQTRASDLKTVHERPALLQELAWSPRYGAGRTLPDVDPVREIVFSFYSDQLYRIAVHYDRARTAGLTHADMVSALTAVYGSPLSTASLPVRQNRVDPAEAITPIAQWRQGDTTVSLHWSDYRGGFGLLVTSQRLNDMAQTASAASVAMDAREAPAREAARQKKETADKQAAEELTRATNKGAFLP
jgi:hypothetical protein